MISQILQIWLYDMIMMHCKQKKFAIYLVTLFKEKKNHTKTEADMDSGGLTNQIRPNWTMRTQPSFSSIIKWEFVFI